MEAFLNRKNDLNLKLKNCRGKSASDILDHIIENFTITKHKKTRTTILCLKRKLEKIEAENVTLETNKRRKLE